MSASAVMPQRGERVDEPLAAFRTVVSSIIQKYRTIKVRNQVRNVSSYCVGLIALFMLVPAADAEDSNVQAIEKTYKAWVEATNEKDIERWSSFLAEEPYFSPADAPPLTNREAVLAYYEKLFADPEFSLDCEQLEVHVAGSGDLAWSRGTCEATFTMPDGNKGRGSSQWIKVWTKYPDGSWKGRINSWKADT